MTEPVSTGLPEAALTAAAVHATLGRWLLTDGLDLVVDLEGSQGAWLRDARNGRKYLDFLTFFASSPLGFNHPKMRDPDFLRVLHRVAQLKPSLSDMYTLEYAEFVRAFARHAMPPYLTHAFFIEGGALANENAMKTAFDWKVRRNRRRGIPGERGQQILHFREAFHGRSGYTLSVTNTDPVKTDLFPKFVWPRIENPKLRFPLDAETERDVIGAEQRALEQIDAAFADNPDDIAAILIEPVQGEGGDNHFRGEFLRALERIAHERDCLFIVDEVQTGIGLTGELWAHQHFGLRPDVLAFGKKAQVCGCLAGPRIDEEPDNVFRVPSRLNSTWGGGLTDMVRCGRFLEIIAEEELVANAKQVGAHLLGELEKLQQELSGVVTNARGRGLMIAFDLADQPTRKRAQRSLMDEGLLVLTCGTRSIRFRPPLNLSRQEADEGLERLRAGLQRLGQ